MADPNLNKIEIDPIQSQIHRPLQIEAGQGARNGATGVLSITTQRIHSAASDSAVVYTPPAAVGLSKPTMDGGGGGRKDNKDSGGGKEAAPETPE